jgi:hypothetical protein
MERTISGETNKISSAAQRCAPAEPVEREELPRDEEIISPERARGPIPEIGAVINEALRAAGLLRN